MGDTYEQALAAADHLLREGVRPTQQKVREQLGKGSLSTINRALNDWWQSLGPRLEESQQTPDLPPHVADAMGALWEQAVRTAQQLGEEQVMAARQDAQQARHALEEERVTQERLRSELLQRLDTAYEKIEQLQRQLSQAHDENHQLQRDALEAQRRAARLDHENRALEAQGRHLEDALEAQREHQSSGQLEALRQENLNLKKAFEALDSKLGQERTLNRK